MTAFGRRIEFDERSRGFPVTAALTASQQTPRSYTWRNPIRLDQGNLGSCVGNAWTHEAAARPFEVPGLNEKVAVNVYNRAQQFDAYDDTPAGGGHLGAGRSEGGDGVGLAEAVPLGLQGFDDLVLAVGHKGPAVLGINWWTPG